MTTKSWGANWSNPHPHTCFPPDAGEDGGQGFGVLKRGEKLKPMESSKLAMPMDTIYGRSERMHQLEEDEAS